ncbi:AAA domain-containing protein [Coprinopsis sp. MPI-PUGE-AT-0042]|nr:AAA domain-containing protein [Coprinopsis sp. MPI-PUGE-AT-0042]
MAPHAVDLAPLIGDSAGHVRILVVGNSGSGKSTTAAKLGRQLGIPFISLDHIHWEPGWKSTPNDAFKSKIEVALAEAGPSWVVEGDYYERIGNIVLDKSTDVIWLDPPLLLYFPRLLLRTFLRLFGLQAPCSPGCDESFSEAFFSKDSIILWCLTHHRSEREKNTIRMREVGLNSGSDIEPSSHEEDRWLGRRIQAWMEEVEKSKFKTETKLNNVIKGMRRVAGSYVTSCRSNRAMSLTS